MAVGGRHAANESRRFPRAAVCFRSSSPDQCLDVVRCSALAGPKANARQTPIASAAPTRATPALEAPFTAKDFRRSPSVLNLGCIDALPFARRPPANDSCSSTQRKPGARRQSAEKPFFAARPPDAEEMQTNCAPVTRDPKVTSPVAFWRQGLSPGVSQRRTSPLRALGVTSHGRGPTAQRMRQPAAIPKRDFW